MQSHSLQVQEVRHIPGRGEQDGKRAHREDTGKGKGQRCHCGREFHLLKLYNWLLESGYDKSKCHFEKVEL